MGKRSQQRMTGLTQQDRIHACEDDIIEKSIEAYLIKQFWKIVLKVADELNFRQTLWFMERMI